MSVRAPRRRRPHSFTTPVRRAAAATVESLESRQLLSAGALDSVYTGKIDLAGPTADAVHAVGRQSDGKVLVAGLHGINPAGFDLARIKLDGSLDFDTVLPANIRPVDILQDNSGDIYVAGPVGAPENDFGVVKLSSAGVVDTSFGTGGLRVIDFGGTDTYGRMTLQTMADNSRRIVLAGRANNAFAVARLNLNGSFDAGFGAGGKAMTTIGSGAAMANDILPDGDALIAGGYSMDGSGRREFTLVRYLSGGAVDATFGTAGVKVWQFQSGTDSQVERLAANGANVLAIGNGGALSSVAMLQVSKATGAPDGTFNSTSNTNGAFLAPTANLVTVSAATVVSGQIFIAGRRIGGNPPVGEIRYTPAGGAVSLDPTVYTTTLGNAAAPRSNGDVEIQSDGTVVAAASVLPNLGLDMNYDTGLINPNGSQGALYSVGFTGPGLDAGNDVANYGTGGKVVAVGSTIDGRGFSRGVLVRRNANGSADTTFGSGGRVQFDFNTIGQEALTAVAVDGTDILVAATTATGAYVVRLDANGNVLHTDHLTTVVLSSGLPLRLGVDASHNAILAGTNSDNDFFVARFLPGGGLDPTFGTGGVAIVDVDTANDPLSSGPSDDQLQALLVLNDGSILVAGGDYDYDTFNIDFALAKLTPAGALDHTFGDNLDGVVTTDFGGSDDVANAIAIQGSRIVVAGSSFSSQIAITAFSMSGVQDLAYAANPLAYTTTNGAQDLAVDSQGNLLLLATADSGQGEVLVLRLDGSGNLDPSYGTSGEARYDYAGVGATAGGLAVRSDGSAIVVGSTNDPVTFNDIALVRFTGNAVVGSQPPVADHNIATGAEDTLITVTLSGSDDLTSNAALTVTVLAVPAHGTLLDAGLTPVSNGQTFVGSPANFTFVPDADYNGNDVVTYTVTDGDNQTSFPATVSITVNPVNDAPIANPGSRTTAEDTATSGSVSATDVDSPVLTYVLVAGPSHGSLALNADGTFTYTPAANYNGPDSFTFKANDGSLDSATASVSITVTPVNDAPVLPTGLSFAVNENSPTGLAVGTITATDIDGPSLTYSITAGNPGNVFAIDNAGHITVNGPLDFETTSAYVLTVKASDGSLSDSKTVVVNVNNVNEAPVASPQAISTAEDTPKTGSVLATDPDAGATLTYTLVDQALHGTVVVNANGSFTYTPNPDYNGADSFTFRASDGSLNSNVATVTINVTPVNDAPTAANASASTTEDTNLTVDLRPFVSDIETPDASLTYNILTVTNGTLTATATPGVFTFHPAANYNGPASFSYSVTDNGVPALTSGSATVGITVMPVNDAPTANSTSVTTAQNTAVTIDLRTLVSDVETPTASLAFTVGGASNGTVALLGDGHTAQFTPATGYSGAASFTYTVTDTGDATAAPITSGPVTINVTVLPPAGPTVTLVGGVLTITGTTANNTITLNTSAGFLTIQVDAQSFPSALATAVNSIVINAGDGNDVITLSSSVTQPAEIHGGNGIDVISSGSGDDLVFGDGDSDVLLGNDGADVLLGGDGDDFLAGGDGRDILVGGRGADFLSGMNDDDVLIAGSLANTALSNLSAIRSAWLSSAGYTTRVNNLKSTLLRPDIDVLNDASVDVLIGNNGRDWFIDNSDQTNVDIVLDKAGNETVTDVDTVA